MILRLDLTTDVNLARATFLWGPDGSWGSEQHSFNSSVETYLGGAYLSNITNNMWSGELYLPWDFLPPNMTNIQGIETAAKDTIVCTLYPSNPTSSDISDLMKFSHPIDTAILVDEDINQKGSSIWHEVTVNAVLIVVLVVTAAAAVGGVTTYASASAKCDGCKGCHGC